MIDHPYYFKGVNQIRDQKTKFDIRPKGLIFRYQLPPKKEEAITDIQLSKRLVHCWKNAVHTKISTYAARLTKCLEGAGLSTQERQAIHNRIKQLNTLLCDVKARREKEKVFFEFPIDLNQEEAIALIVQIVACFHHLSCYGLREMNAHFKAVFEYKNEALVAALKECWERSGMVAYHAKIEEIRRLSATPQPGDAKQAAAEPPSIVHADFTYIEPVMPSKVEPCKVVDSHEFAKLDEFFYPENYAKSGFLLHSPPALPSFQEEPQTLERTSPTKNFSF